jgi:hypothetical protein
MLGPRGKANVISPNPKSNQKNQGIEKDLSPNSRRMLAFRSKNNSVLNSGISPDSKRSNSPFEKHERSFSTLYSKFQQHKTYGENHALGYTADEIKQAVNFIFKKYDTNHDNFLDRQEVKKLIGSSLLHMGQSHAPTELEIVEFIEAMDKNSDGKLSRDELEKAFKRANRI